MPRGSGQIALPLDWSAGGANDGPLISAYLDGELAADDRDRVEAWLADDARARRRDRRG